MRAVLIIIVLMLAGLSSLIYYGYTRPGVPLADAVLVSKVFTAGSIGTGITSVKGHTGVTVVSTSDAYTFFIRGVRSTGDTVYFKLSTTLEGFASYESGTHFRITEYWWGYGYTPAEAK